MAENDPETPEALRNRDMPVTSSEELQALGRVVNGAREEVADSSREDSLTEEETEGAEDEPSIETESNQASQPPDSPDV